MTNLEMVCKTCKDVTDHLLLINPKRCNRSTYDPFKILDRQRQVMCTQCGRMSYKFSKFLVYYAKDPDKLYEQT